MLNLKNKKNRLVTKYTREASWLTLPLSVCFLSVNTFAQDVPKYVAPDVNIFSDAEQVFELPGSGDYISSKEFNVYNFNNINEILKKTPGVYTREEDGFGLFPNISLRGTDTLRSAKITVMEDGINIAPAPYSAPDAYYSPLAAKMHGIEILKGSSQFRFGPHTTGGALNYLTSPIDFGQRVKGSVTYGSFNDKTTFTTGNYGLTGSFGAVAILGEIYYRENDGFRDFNGAVDTTGTAYDAGGHGPYGSDDAGGLQQIAPMVKVLWQLPTSTPITLELKGSYNGLDYNEGYAGLTTADFNSDPYQRYVGSQLDNMNSNAYTYYAKFRVGVNDNVTNNTTLYYNGFGRDWFKISTAGGDSLSKVTSKAYTGSGLTVLKGTASGTVKYRSNNRKYHAYGVMNETDLKFAFGRVKHDLKVGIKAHYDKIKRDQYDVSYTQATTGALSGGATTFNANRTQFTKGLAGYFEEKAKFEKFTFTAGSRLEFVDQSYINGAAAEVRTVTYAFVPGGGVVYDYGSLLSGSDNLKIFGGVYKGFSMPSPSGSANDGTPVKPEKSIAKEIGARYASDTLGVQAVLFHTDFEDLIAIDNSGAGSTADSVGKAINKGIELSATYAPRDILPKGDLSFYGNFTFSNANIDGDFTSTSAESIYGDAVANANLPYMPEYQAAWGADWAYDKFTFGVNITYHSSSFGTAGETESEILGTTPDARAGKIDEAFLLNFSGSYKINENYMINAGIKNATDLEYISSRHPGGARAGAPLAAWVKATANF